MKIITLWQPWASLVALNLKQYETRSWPTNYRGLLLIHAAKRPVNSDEVLSIRYGVDSDWVDMKQLQALEQLLDQDLPLGVVVAIADLTACLEMVWDISRSPSEVANIDLQPQLERAVGDWSLGRYAWKLSNVQRLVEPIPWRGGQGLRDAPPELQALVNAAPKVDCLVPF